MKRVSSMKSWNVLGDKYIIIFLFNSNFPNGREGLFLFDLRQLVKLNYRWHICTCDWSIKLWFIIFPLSTVLSRSKSSVVQNFRKTMRKFKIVLNELILEMPTIGQIQKKGWLRVCGFYFEFLSFSNIDYMLTLKIF